MEADLICVVVAMSRKVKQALGFAASEPPSLFMSVKKCVTVVAHDASFVDSWRE